MMGTLGIFHGARFSFDSNSAYLKRNRGTSSLAREFTDIFDGCARGANDPIELDILWSPWVVYES